MASDWLQIVKNHFEIMVHALLRFKDPSPSQEGDGIVFHIFWISEESFKSFILGPFTTAARQRRRCNLMSEPLQDHKFQGMENSIYEINVYFKIYFSSYTMLYFSMAWSFLNVLPCLHFLSALFKFYFLYLNLKWMIRHFQCVA